jgi:hypothetical protein
MNEVELYGGFGEGAGGGEEDAVFEVNVAVEVFFEVVESGEERAVGVAGLGRGLEDVGQLAQPGEGFAGVVVFVEHAGEGAIQGNEAAFSGCEFGDGWEEDFFLLHQVGGEFFLEVAEDVEDFKERLGVTTVNASYPLGHGVKAWEFAPEIGVVGLHDVGRQLVRGQVGRVLSGGRFVGEFGFELLDDGVEGNALAFAGFAEGASTLATEIDAEVLEYAGAAGAFGNEFAHGAFPERGSSR